jgi:hypothetical protein
MLPAVLAAAQGGGRQDGTGWGMSLGATGLDYATTQDWSIAAPGLAVAWRQSNPIDGAGSVGQLLGQMPQTWREAMAEWACSSICAARYADCRRYEA